MLYGRKKTYELVKVLESEEHKNFLHMIEAIAINFHFSFKQKRGVGKIYTKTTLLTEGDYNVVRILGKWTGRLISCYIIYVIFQVANEKKKCEEEVVGNGKAIFKVSIFQVILHTKLKKMKKKHADFMQTQSFSVHNMYGSGAFDQNSSRGI